MGLFYPKGSANNEWQNRNHPAGKSSACLWGGGAGGEEDQSHLQQQLRQSQGKHMLLGTIWFLIFKFYQCLCTSVLDLRITKHAMENKEWGRGKPIFAVLRMRSFSSTWRWRNKGNSGGSWVGWWWQRPGAGLEQKQIFVHPKPFLDSDATITPITLCCQGCSTATSNRFALDLTRANVHRMKISTLHPHIFREIKSCAFKCNYAHQKCPTFIQLRNINSSSALIRLQSGRSAKYLKKNFTN